MRCLLSGLFLSVINLASVKWLPNDSRCSGNQITWIHETSHKVIGCSPCPACPPGTEYSIPCSTKAVNGTTAKCVACPRGKFSKKFDNRPCVACTRCSKRYIKKVCTPHRNAVCGDCIAGYHDNKVTFSCDECGRCCNDGKDQAPLGCARVGMCKTRPYGCPILNRTRTKPTVNWPIINIKESNASKIFTQKYKKIQSQSATKARISSSRPTKPSPFLTKSMKTFFTSRADPQSKVERVDQGYSRDNFRQEDTSSSQSILLYVLLSLLVLILLILLAAATMYSKKKQRPELERSLSSSYTTNQLMPVPTPEDRTLEDFVEKGHDVVDSVCLLLSDKLRNGIWDFERVALRFGLTKEERIAIKQTTTGGNPTRELMEVLCSRRPKITVKQFAQQVKHIKRNDVYEKLQPFFSN